MTKQFSTKQLEKNLSLKIRDLYSTEIGWLPQKVTCKLFSKYLAIIANEPLTPIERNLWNLGKKHLREQVRQEINNIFNSRMFQIIEETLEVTAVEILNNVTFSSNEAGILVVLSEPPKLQRSDILLKVKVDRN